MTTPAMTTALAMPASGLVIVSAMVWRLFRAGTRCAGTTGQTSG